MSAHDLLESVLSEMRACFDGTTRPVPPADALHRWCSNLTGISAALERPRPALTPPEPPYVGAMNDPDGPNPYVLADSGIESVANENATAVRWKELFLLAIHKSPLDAPAWTLNLAEHYVRSRRAQERGAALPPQTGNPAPSVYELSDDDVAVFLSVHRAEIENDGSAESAVREGWKVVTANRVNRGVSSLRAPQSRPGLYGFLAAQGDLLAQHIRTVDGSNSLGAGALAERLVECGWRHSLNVGAGSGAETPPQPEIPK